MGCAGVALRDGVRMRSPNVLKGCYRRDDGFVCQVVNGEPSGWAAVDRSQWRVTCFAAAHGCTE